MKALSFAIILLLASFISKFQIQVRRWDCMGAKSADWCSDIEVSKLTKKELLLRKGIKKTVTYCFSIKEKNNTLHFSYL